MYLTMTEKPSDRKAKGPPRVTGPSWLRLGAVGTGELTDRTEGIRADGYLMDSVSRFSL